MTQPIVAQVQGFISGGKTTAPASNDVLAVHCACLPGRIRRVVAAVIPGTQGATTTILDVRNNGASVWTDPNQRPTLPGGSAASVFTTYSPNHSAIRPGDIISLVVVQAGNNTNVAMTVAIEDP